MKRFTLKAALLCAVSAFAVAETPALAQENAELPEIIPQAVRKPSYSQVYRSIPFRRSEFEANPLYRHEATIELLLGQIRPVIKNTVVTGSPLGVVTPYRYRHGEKGVNYHFYYPRPSGYRRY